MSEFISLPVELQVQGQPTEDGKPTTEFKTINLNVRSGAVLATSPAQDAPKGSEGITVVYFDAEAGMKPVTTPLTDVQVLELIEDAKYL